jgi:hypothetical protein
MKMELHESVRVTYTEQILKESEGFRLVLKKHEVLAPKGLFSINMEQQSLKDGKITDTAVYNFFMNKTEMAALASALTA